MKTFLACLFIVLTGFSRISAQTPDPAASPADVPTPAAPVATPAPPDLKRDGDDQHTKPAATPETDSATLTQLENDWGNAIVHNDQAALQRIVADEYMSVSPDGAVAYRAEHLAAAEVVAGKINSFRFSSVQVRVYGETAVVTGDGMIDWATNEIDGALTTATPFRWIDVFVKRDGRWQAVASQATNVSKSASRLGAFSPPGT